jgi:hypothetical protein
MDAGRAKDESEPVRKPQRDRRRLNGEIPRRLRDWLLRVQRATTVITTVIRLHKDPDRGGEGELVERAKSHDHTLIYDALTHSMQTFSAVHGEIDNWMDGVPPTSAKPGTAAKVEVLGQRAATRRSLFVEDDERI